MENKLERLVTDIKDRNAHRKDYISSSEYLTMDNAANFVIHNGHDVIYEPTKIAHGQIAGKLKIPGGYYDRMLQTEPDLLAKNVNTWLGREQENYFIRTYEYKKKEQSANIMRALLSENYKVMDSLDVVTATFEALHANRIGVDVVQANMTESRLYLKVISKTLEADAKDLLRTYRNPVTNDSRIVTARMGIEITNSEVGKGSFQLMPFLHFNICVNQLKIASGRLRKIHLGAKIEGDNDEWSQRTEVLNSQLIISQVNDAISNYFTPKYMRKAIDDLQGLADNKLKHPVEAVQNVVQLAGYSEERRDAILNYFVQGGDTSQFGIIQALTFEAHENPDDDVRYDAENFAAAMVTEVGKYDKPFSAN